MKRALAALLICATALAAANATALGPAAGQAVVLRAIELSPVELQRLFQGREELIRSSVREAAQLAVEPGVDANDVFDMATLHADLSSPEKIDDTLRELIKASGLLFAAIGPSQPGDFDSALYKAELSYSLRFDGYHSFTDYAQLIERTDALLAAQSRTLSEFAAAPRPDQSDSAAQASCAIYNVLVNLTADLWVTVLSPAMETLTAPQQPGKLLAGRAAPPSPLPANGLYLAAGNDAQIAFSAMQDLPAKLGLTEYGTPVAIDYAGPIVTIDDAEAISVGQPAQPRNEQQIHAEQQHRAAVTLQVHSHASATSAGTAVPGALEQLRLNREQQRIAQERIEQQRIEQERIEQQRIEQERIEQQRIEQQRIEQQRVQAQSSALISGLTPSRGKAAMAGAAILEQRRNEQQAAQMRSRSALALNGSGKAGTQSVGALANQELERRRNEQQAAQMRSRSALALNGRGKAGAQSIGALANQELERRRNEQQAARLRVQSMMNLAIGQGRGHGSLLEELANRTVVLEATISGNEVSAVDIDESKLIDVRGVDPSVGTGTNEIFDALASMNVGNMVNGNGEQQRSLKQGEGGNGQAEQVDITAGHSLADGAQVSSEEKTMLNVRSGSLSYASGTQQGQLDAQAVAQILADNHRGFSYCYESQLKHNPNLSGKVTIEFTIGEDGRVTRADVVENESDLTDNTVRKCIVDRFLRLKFPPPVGGDVTVKYPLIFAPSFSF